MTDIDWLAVARKAAEDTLAAIDSLTPPTAVKEVELPTETGYYLDSHGGFMRVLNNSHGDPEFWANGETFVPETMRRTVAPYTRLEPVPVTAKKVLERYEALMGTKENNSYYGDLAQVAAEFGVSND